MTKIAPLTPVWFRPGDAVKDWIQNNPDKAAQAYPFRELDHLLFLGEIPGMEGHCAVVGRDGKIHWAYHTEDFVVVPEDDL